MSTEQSMQERYPEYLEELQQNRRSDENPSYSGTSYSEPSYDDSQYAGTSYISPSYGGYDDPYDQQTPVQPPQPSRNQSQPSTGFAQMARSGFSSKKPKIDEKYKYQIFGILVTGACAAYCLFSVLKPAKIIYINLMANFNDRFTFASEYFPHILMYLFASYFFVKCVIVPSYAGGKNLSIKYWPLSFVQEFNSYLLINEIFTILFAIKKIGAFSGLFDILRRYDYIPMLILFAKAYICKNYMHAAQYGDKEFFSCFKPWVVDEGEEDDMDRRI